MRVVKHCHELPKDVVDVPSLENLQGQAGWNWSNLVQWKVSLPKAGGGNR